MKMAALDSGINYVEVADEAAFYGPKIDVQVWSATGRDLDAGAVSVRLLGEGNVGAKAKGEVVAEILHVIKERNG